MNNNLLVAPVVVPFLTAMLLVFLRRNVGAQRIIAGLGSLSLPVIGWMILSQVRAEGVQILRVGEWPAAFGIVWMADLLTAIMLLFAGITHFAVWWFLAAGGARQENERTLLYPLFLIMGGAVNWAFITGDLFNLFVSFEIMLISSYVLLGHGSQGPQLRETVKYVVLNLVASMLFLMAAGFAYGVFGSLNMAELAVRIRSAEYPPEAIVLGTMLFLVFATKAAAFPLFYWLPDSYPKAPPGIVAYFGGILTKVGIYCLYRFFTLTFDEAVFDGWFQRAILIIAGLTMFIGVMGAYSQYSFRRILSFHIVSQIGYMIFGLGMFTPAAIAFGIFFIIHNMVVKASLLLVGDSVLVNEGTEQLKKTSGLMREYPFLAGIFFVAALSLAGLPPTSGFYGKFGFVLEGFRQEHFITVAVSLVTGLFTLASMVKIWRYSFWGERVRGPREGPRANGVIFATAGLVAVAVLLAVGSGWVTALCVESGEQLLDRRSYIGAVLGDAGIAAFDSGATAAEAVQ